MAHYELARNLDTYADGFFDDIDEGLVCPECGSYALVSTDEPDEDGLVEYRCSDCGHYFVD